MGASDELAPVDYRHGFTEPGEDVLAGGLQDGPARDNVYYLETVMLSVRPNDASPSSELNTKCPL